MSKSFKQQYSCVRKPNTSSHIFVDCFYKPKKNSALTFVFFDIATKQVLLIDKYDANEADGYGLPHFWAQSCSVTITKYLVDVYKQNKKKFNK